MEPIHTRSKDPDGVDLTEYPPLPTPEMWARVCQLLSDLTTNYQRDAYDGEMYDYAGEKAHDICQDLRIPYNYPDYEKNDADN